MEDINKSLAEVSVILNLMDEEDKNKIPNKFLEYIEKRKDKNYRVIIDPEEPLENQNLLEDTINILALLKLNYWCKSQEEKEELEQLFKANEEKYQAELREKYNPDNIFKDTKAQKIEENSNTEECNLPVEVKKDTIIKRIIQFIKKFIIRGNC